MSRGPLHDENYKPQFSGHETFPMRYGWLKKVYDAVVAAKDGDQSSQLFTQPEAIARFGVGKNMVTSMRHWATATGILRDINNSRKLEVTDLGHLIFAPKGLDPYLEDPNTLWLLHWNLCNAPTKTTWYWAFNHQIIPTFERETLVNALLKLSSDRSWKRIARTTVKRDVECFVRTYVPKKGGISSASEDNMECPLSELGLIKSTHSRDGFRFDLSPKKNLGNGILVHALQEFWSNRSSATTLSFESILHDPGSPGMVFRISEEELAQRLENIEHDSNGYLRWSETAGLRQLIRTELKAPKLETLLRSDLKNNARKGLAA